MFERSLARPLAAALADTPVVMLVGARQSGKSTLVLEVPGRGHHAEYLTLDDPTELAAARADPSGFVEGLPERVIVDEIQRAPELFLPIKAAVDRQRRPGRFLLTGSTNALLIPTVAEALAGRMEVLTLWPLSAAELDRHPADGFVEWALDPDPDLPGRAGVERSTLVARVAAGGFPEAVEREEDRRRRWFAGYLTTILERDVRGLADIERLDRLPALLSSIALRSRGPLNKTSLSRDLGIPNSSIDRYLALLERVFLVKRLPAWHGRLQARLVKSPKLLLADSGLLCYLLRCDEARLTDDPTAFGVALESYVGMELVKSAELSDAEPRVFHYRTAKGAEIDFVLEAADGRVAGVEVKAARGVDEKDFSRFEAIRDALGDRFVRGIVLYAGDRVVRFGDRFEAWPVGLLGRG
jgi:predicted AAA+ superfamily ATPase